MNIGSYPAGVLRARLHGPGLDLPIGPFVARVRSDVPGLEGGIRRMYGSHELLDAAFADFHIRLLRARGPRRWYRPQVNFHLDGHTPFKPLPLDQAYAMLEWGLNWCIASHMHGYLMLHAGVLARGGQALIMPAPPGSGKSTLSAALSYRGWRLLSDELALIDPANLRLTGLARPVSLKNQSIDVIRRFLPEAELGPTVHDTLKGDVAHLQPHADAVRDVASMPLPAWVVFPRWHAGAACRLEAVSKSAALMRLADGAFNYSLLGEAGFRAAADVVARCACYEFVYSRLDEALDAFSQLPPPDAH